MKIHLICRFDGGLIFSMFTLARVVHTNCPHDAGVKVSPPKGDHVRRAPVLDGVLIPFPTALVSTNPDKNNSGFMLDPYKIITMIFCHLQAPLQPPALGLWGPQCSVIGLSEFKQWLSIIMGLVFKHSPNSFIIAEHILTGRCANFVEYKIDFTS